MQAVSPTVQQRPDWLPRAILSGFIATSVMLFTFVVAYGIGLVLAGLDIAEKRGAPGIRSWFQGLTHNQFVDLTSANLYLALAIFFAGGIALAVLYAYVADWRLPGPGWFRGLLFSLVLWALSLVVVLPIVGGGFFGVGLGAGPLPIVGNLILSLIYGAILGLVYGPFGDIISESSPPSAYFAAASAEEEARAMAGSEQMAAMGMLVGAGLGTIIGIVGAVLAQMQPGGTILGVAPIAFIVASALIGGTCGALIGSLVGLPSPTSEVK